MMPYRNIIFGNKRCCASDGESSYEITAAEVYPVHHLLGVQLLRENAASEKAQTKADVEDKIVFYFTSGQFTVRGKQLIKLWTILMEQLSSVPQTDSKGIPKRMEDIEILQGVYYDGYTVNSLFE